jgi:dephospho-CoA kinase
VTGPGDVVTGPSAAHRRDPVRIGLTGSIGCGKSTVAGLLARRGAVVIDADRLARDVTEPGEPALQAIADRFGREMIGADGRLDRAGLGRIVFADPAALAALEAIVHPAVRPRIVAALGEAGATTAPAVILEAIRLVEGGYADLLDEIWLVLCSPDTQRERLAARGMDPADVARRIATQAGLVARARAMATRVILTDGSLDATERVVYEAFDAALGAPR